MNAVGGWAFINLPWYIALRSKKADFFKAGKGQRTKSNNVCSEGIR